MPRSASAKKKKLIAGKRSASKAKLKHSPVPVSIRSRSASKKSRSNRERSRSASLSPGGSPCLDYLRKKIKKNMKEYYSGQRYVSPKQAIAVSYAQTIKAKPSCKLIFKKR